MKKSGIQRLQTYLNGNGNNLVVDGIWGEKSKKAYLNTWKAAESAELKDIGFVEWECIKHASRHPKVTKVGNLQENFIVGIGAGHSGVFDNDWIYPTAPSKMYRHSKMMHYGNTFYEGYENRVVSEMLIRELTYKGIQTLRCKLHLSSLVILRTVAAKLQIDVSLIAQFYAQPVPPV